MPMLGRYVKVVKMDGIDLFECWCWIW